MANVDDPHGFQPVSPIYSCNRYDKDASDTVIYKGDVVDAEADGSISNAAAGSVQILGASADYSAASTAKDNMMVWDNPMQQYNAQDNADATPARTDVGLMADHEANAPGTTSLLRSGFELDWSTRSTAAAGFRILDLIVRPDNSIANNADWRVVCVEHAALATTGI